MKAREELIRAYSFFSLKGSSAGDHDIGARGTHEPVRRKAQLRQFGKTRYAADPSHFTQTKGKSINSTSIIAAATRAGKIIAAAEGRESHTVAYSRVYHCDTMSRSERAEMESRLAVYLVGTIKARLRGREDSIINFGDVIIAYSKGKEPRYIDSEQGGRVYTIARTLINSLDKGCLISVGNWLKLDNDRENDR